ncbi:MAG: cob(I)yrinic acid a,c-diamide adenosyltransferase [Clostridia bacterium]|nr:cob(I)yrinic acid a,c-diamide adenosyltransferase [Clostridia bacterium]
MTRQNIPKNSPIFEVLGTLDELCSQLGVAKRSAGEVSAIIEQIQADITAVCGELAGGKKFVDRDTVARLEQAIDTICADGVEFTGFVLPGSSTAGAALDVARTVARRAERCAVASSQTGGFTRELLAWFNRLSDLLYALARLCDRKTGESTIPTGTSLPIAADGFADKALRLCLAVRERAAQMGVRAVTAVCDAGGNPVAMLRADDAFIASVDIAMNKAFTSVSLKMSTDELSRLAQPGQSLYGIQFTNSNRIVIFGGGVPLVEDGLIIGGFGVSGGTAEQDTALGEFAKDYYEKELI